jgi:hypothetical protein
MAPNIVHGEDLTKRKIQVADQCQAAVAAVRRTTGVALGSTRCGGCAYPSTHYGCPRCGWATGTVANRAYGPSRTTLADRQWGAQRGRSAQRLRQVTAAGAAGVTGAPLAPGSVSLLRRRTSRDPAPGGCRAGEHGHQRGVTHRDHSGTDSAACWLSLVTRGADAASARPGGPAARCANRFAAATAGRHRAGRDLGPGGTGLPVRVPELVIGDIRPAWHVAPGRHRRARDRRHQVGGACGPWSMVSNRSTPAARRACAAGSPAGKHGTDGRRGQPPGAAFTGRGHWEGRIIGSNGQRRRRGSLVICA